MIEKIQQIHNDVFFWMHGLLYQSDVFDRIIYLIAEQIDIYIVGLSIFFMAFFFHKKYGLFSKKRIKKIFLESLSISVSILIAWGITALMKWLFAQPRPFLRFPDLVNNLFPYGAYDSFPSGHATLFAAFSTMIFLYHKKAGIFFALAGVAISLARVIAGVHLPVEILVGWLIGVFTSLFVYKKFGKK